MTRLSPPRVVLCLLCLFYFLLFVNRVNISIAAPLIKADLSLTNTQLGLAFSAFAYPYALFQLIGGYFGDSAPEAGDLLRRGMGAEIGHVGVAPLRNH